MSTFLLVGRLPTGTPLYYTGAAGQRWVSPFMKEAVPVDEAKAPLLLSALNKMRWPEPVIFDKVLPSSTEDITTPTL